MGKSFKRIATIIGVAALAATGLGLLIPGVTLGSTFVLGTTAVTLGTLASVGALALSIGSLPGPPIEDTGANSRGTAFVDPDALGCYVFGTTTVQSAVIYEEVTGSEPDRVLHDVFAHAWHRIESYEALYLPSDEGSEVVTFSGDAATGDHANMLWWFRADGTQSAALSGTPFDDNSWPSDAILEGAAHSGIVWNIDDEDFKGKFASVPTKFDIVVEGAWLYDPRLDTGAGGSGSQDFGTPSSWSFNNGNAILVLLRMMIGEYADGELVWGRGIAETDYDIDNFMAMADVADETVDGKPRFRLGGMFMLNGSFEDFVQRWEAETGGKLSKSGGIYRVWLPHDDLTPLTTITENNLLAGFPVTHSAGGIDGLYNTARGRYIEPTEGYRAFGYPQVDESSAITEDGGRRILFHDFSWVQDVSIAERVARIKVRRSRFQRIWTIAIGWAGFGPNYRPFTVHTLNIPETGNDAQLVRVVNREMDPMTGVTILTLQQEDESIYDDTIPLGDPHASDTIPNRLDHLETITPRYIDGTIISPGNIEIVEDFTYADADELHARWTQRESGIPDADIASTAFAGVPNGLGMRFGNTSGNDEWWAALTAAPLVPYDPNETFEVGIIWRHVSGSGTLYMGVEGVDDDGVTQVDRSGGSSYTIPHFVAANAFTGSGSWQANKGYLRGLGTSVTVPSNDPSVPSVARTGVAFIRPVVLLDYNNAAGVVDVARVWIKRLPTVGNPNIGADAATEVYYISDPGPIDESVGSFGVEAGAPFDSMQTIVVREVGDVIDVVASFNAELVGGTGTAQVFLGPDSELEPAALDKTGTAREAVTLSGQSPQASAGSTNYGLYYKLTDTGGAGLTLRLTNISIVITRIRR